MLVRLLIAGIVFLGFGAFASDEADQIIFVPAADIPGLAEEPILFDLKSGEWQGLQIGVVEPTAINASPNGEWLAYLNYGETVLFELTVTNGDETTVLASDEEGLSFAWSPDSEHLAYFDDTGLFITNVETGESTFLLDGLSVTSRISWAGTTIALSAREEPGGPSNLYMVDVESGELTQLTDTAEEVYVPAVSPDGETIAFTMIDEDNIGRLYAMPVSGGEMQLLVDGGANYSPQWVGDDLVYSGYEDGDIGLFFLDMETGKSEMLVNREMIGYFAVSPDENQIAYVGGDDTVELCIINLPDNTENCLEDITPYQASTIDWVPARQAE